MSNELDSWEPFRHMRHFRRRVFELFPMQDIFSGIREPLVDVVDNGNSLQVIAELPGIDKKGLEVNVEDDSVDIKAELKQETKQEKKEEGYYCRERAYQSFYRKIPLPSEVMASKASAEFKNGVLTLNIPKKHPEPKGKGVKVEIK
ncbi:MAG: Hsp20/alpha crystallin family protein [Candidatus Diapherotrites archaeon]|uniref:Hsp20/alpha crystallin family protein n=1 Tax=Candidatus Iainarchaeum sp. TaxID=3101447 RepID=A0A938YPC3_9ARCH|nr:Hsp20/alpha crystallin family protein [Candidatus Diapherotrites archaeon]